eukprot:gb/GEZN01012843.1/.p2 GENE.gb/GEZN01012843.1/~~gb/GEZN01012843.1/.p2  ORF type:complete len:101 (+),score=21.38 gb/GEZN01012843.1/:178-480(+)
MSGPIVSGKRVVTFFLGSLITTISVTAIYIPYEKSKRMEARRAGEEDPDDPGNFFWADSKPKTGSEDTPKTSARSIWDNILAKRKEDREGETGRLGSEQA